MFDVASNAVAGLLVGVLLGATGVGGGAVMTPILVLMFGVAPHTAVGTDLIFASLTKFVGVGVHGAQGRVDWQVMRRLSLGSLPAALLALFWMHRMAKSGVQDDRILLVLGTVLIVTSVAMVAKPMLYGIGKNLRIAEPEQFKRAQLPLTVLAGVALGFLVTMTSVGAGALGVVMLLALYPLRLTAVKLVATDLAHAIPLTLVGGLGHILMGNVDFKLLATLLIGSIPGVWFGAHYVGKLPDKLVRVCVAAVLALVGFKLAWR